MIRTVVLTVILIVALTFSAAVARAAVAFVDNRSAPGGDGSRDRPFATISQGVQSADVVYVAESDKPYLESVTLKKGQLLIGSAFGLDAVKTDLHIETGVTGVPAMQGPGPAIQGMIATSGNNVIAGCTILSEGLGGITGNGAIGTLTVRNVFFKTSRSGGAINLQEQQGNVTISGGAIDATERGGGIALGGGYGDVVIERMPISGEFLSAVRVQGRRSGTVTFRRGTKLHVRDSYDDAVVVSNIERPGAVIFEDTIDVRGHRRGVVVYKVAKLVIGGSSRLSTINAAALDVRDSGVELSFESVSAEGIAPGTLDEGIVLDNVHGHVAITGMEGKIGSGGSIQHARGNGMRIAQTGNIRMSGITLTDSGINKPVRGVRCAGAFDVNSTAICRASVYLRHVTDSAFDNIVVDGGSAIGVNANNIRNVTFGGLDVHGAGDETFESGVLLQEIGGTVTFSRSSFIDNAGSEILIEQRYNSGKLVLDRCTLAATGRPQIAPHLLDVHTFGASKVDVELRTVALRDNLGSAIDATAGDTSSYSIDMRDSSLQHFGHGVVTAAARQGARAGLTLRGNSIVALVSDRAWVDVAGTDSAKVCVDLAANQFSPVPGTVIHLRSTGQAAMAVVGAAATDAHTIAANLTAANGGAVTVIDGRALAAAACN